jgi:transcriptional regulator with XRE-family HTH domain
LATQRAALRVTDITALDRIVGLNIRRYRERRGVSQQALGQSIGVSFQQIQKYESGRNRIAASRLYHVHKALGVPLRKFFEP